jgi:acetyl-CoA synthetase
VEDPEAFWAGHAEQFVWRKKWDKVLQWNFDDPEVKWFLGGQLNITENCLDRHLAERGDQAAILWEPNNPGEEGKKFSYRELHAEVCRFANVLKNKGARKGDRICLYMPMVPELAIAVLACARIGAIHSVVFGGFSTQSLAGRIQDADCSLVVTADGAFRGAKDILLKPIVDEALQTCPTVKHVIVLRRTGKEVSMTAGRDTWWQDEISKAQVTCEAEVMDAEDMLFILYTSGSTGKPKGVVHTTGGYMVYTDYSFRNVFQYNPGEIFWCTADIGWITGHSYLVYGPLLAGATTLMFEGIPTWPDAGRFWQVIDKYRVNIFYTAPTAIRSLMAYGNEVVNPYALDSLRVLGTVGEPINEEAWHWYDEHIGKKRCPVVDTWWQTETGGILISPLAGITPTKPSYATLPLPGIQPAILDEKGMEIPERNPDGTRMPAEGRLCMKFPWPSIIRTTYKNHERCRHAYFEQYPGYYFTGDGCKRNANGYYRITGRVDDVIKVSGHLLGTAEIENAINEHPDIVESAVVGYPHPIKGWAIYAYVIDEHGRADTESLKKEIIDTVCKCMGSIARPDKIQVVKGLPKTRSGKIMRRILRKIAEGESSDFGDISTLLDPDVVAEIKTGAI